MTCQMLSSKRTVRRKTSLLQVNHRTPTHASKNSTRHLAKHRATASAQHSGSSTKQTCICARCNSKENQ
jgi:hypothetical protein